MGISESVLGRQPIWDFGLISLLSLRCCTSNPPLDFGGNQNYIPIGEASTQVAILGLRFKISDRMTPDNHRLVIWGDETQAVLILPCQLTGY